MIFQEEAETQLKNFETKHTQTREVKPEPANRLRKKSSVQISWAKPDTPNRRRSTQPFYDSQLQRLQGRNRNNTGSSVTPKDTLLLKHPRMFKQQFTFLQHEEDEREFLAYCIVSKESNSGIFTHERLLVIDSKEKTISYYTDLPDLPLRNVQALRKPKEIININSNNRITINKLLKGIGQVTISWSEETKKEWRLTMGNKKVVQELGILIQQIKNNHYKNLHSVKRALQPVAQLAPRGKINKQETKFITQIKQLQSKRGSKVSSLQSLEQLSRVKAASKQTSKKSIQTKYPFSKKKDYKGLIESQKKSHANHEIKTKLQDKPEKDTKVQQIRLQNIMAAADAQFRQRRLSQSSNASIDRTPNELTSLDRLVKRRKDSIPAEEAHSKEDNLDSVGLSKVLVKKIEQYEQEKYLKHIQTPKKIKPEIEPRPLSSKYQQNQKLYRMALLEQRRQVNSEICKNVKGIRKSCRQSESPSHTFSLVSHVKVQQKAWLIQWLQAKSRNQLAFVYDRFVTHCQKFVECFLETIQEEIKYGSNSKSIFTVQNDSIQYTFFLFVNKDLREDMQQMEKQFLEDFQNTGYLINSLKFKAENSVTLGFPLVCVVIYRGLKIFCRASLQSRGLLAKSDQVRLQYAIQLSQCQKLSKISLEFCDMLELIVENQSVLYFDKIRMPKLGDSVFIDGAFIERYIGQGVIRSEIDAEAILKHYQEYSIPRAINLIENECILSTLELSQLLKQKALNLSCVQTILINTLNSQFSKTEEVCYSQVISALLEEYLREAMQRVYANKNSSKMIIDDIVYRELRDWQRGDKTIIHILENKLKKYFGPNKIGYLPSLVNAPYILTSLFWKLGIRVQIKKRMNLEQLENEGTIFWKKIQFSPKNLNIFFTSQVLKYPYALFNKDYSILEQNVFSSQSSLPIDSLKSIINHSPNQPLQNSYLYRLMSHAELAKVNYYLSISQAPQRKYLQPKFRQENYQLYYNLVYHPTAFILGHYHLQQDLMGIKWLMRQKKNDQAHQKIEEQLFRVLVWARNDPKLLMDIYDLKAVFSLNNKSQNEAMTASLKTLQLAIHNYGRKDQQNWLLIWQKAFQAANIHFQFKKLQQALAFYQTCTEVFENIKNDEINQPQMALKALTVYRKRANINVLLCRIDLAIDLCASNFQKFKQLRELKVNELSFLVNLLLQEFESHLLLLRCLQIKNDSKSLLRQVGLSCLQFIEPQIKIVSREAYVSQINQSNRYRFVQLNKYIWTAVIQNSENMSQYTADQNTFDVIRIKKQIQTIRKKNKGDYHYSMSQVYKYLFETINSHMSKEPPPLKVQNSFFLAKVVKNLQTISDPSFTEIEATIYDEDVAHTNEILFLQCLLHVLTYEYAIGTIDAKFNFYDF